MGIELIYKHQQIAYEGIKDGVKSGKKVAYVFPVGAGKSFPGLKYIEDNPDKNVLIVVPSLGISNQFKKYIKTYVDNGEERLKKNIRIITYQKVSLTQKIQDNMKPDIIMCDEIHRMGAETWEPAIDSLMEGFPEAEVIGMSATPERMDKRNMAYAKFDEIVYEMSLTEALSGEKEGEVILKSPRYVRVISQLKEELGEYKTIIDTEENENKKKRLIAKYEKLEEIVSKAPGIQEVMEQGMQKKNGKYIIFCASREEMLEKMEEAQNIFGKVNTKIKMNYVLSKVAGTDDTIGKTKAQNRRIIEEFENSEKGEELQLLFCVDMLNEGVHIKGIDGEVMFRPTESSLVYKQQMGRVMSSDKEAGETVIIDAVNNWMRQIETYREIERAIGEGGKKEGKEELGFIKLTPEETELLEIMREIGEDLKYNTQRTYEEIIEWLETHDGQMPKSGIIKNGRYLLREEMTKEEIDGIKLYVKWRKSEEKRILDEYEGKPIEEVPEQYIEKIHRLREFGIKGRRIIERNIYEEIIEWLENHNGQLPKSNIIKNGRYLLREEMTEKEQEEVKLGARWQKSEERRILNEYEGKLIDEIPEEYREKIQTLRAFGLKGRITTEKNIWEEIIEWLESHNGNLPRSAISGKRRGEITEEEQYELRLYDKWRNSKEKTILEEYKGKDIEELPEEYRQIVQVLRNFGLGIIEKTSYEQIIEWLEVHNGKLPKGVIQEGKKQKSIEELPEKQQYELRIYNKWIKSEERKVLEKYAGKEIEEVPKEWREKIEILRGYGLGAENKIIYREIIEWLENHNGNLPRGNIYGKSRKEKTKEERDEVNLYQKWKRSEERKILEEYAGKEIEEVPEEWREKIEILRGYGLGLEKKNLYVEMVEWLENNEGKIPRSNIRYNNMILKAKDMTKEEQEEVNLYARWRHSKEKTILEEYAGKEIEEVPEEYREKIQVLRSYGLGLEEIEKDTYEEIIQWLETNGKLPRGVIWGKSRIDMTEEEKNEVNLYGKWYRSQERSALEKYIGKEIEKIPEGWKEKIEKLRSYGLGKKDEKQKTVNEQIIEWLESKGKLPRSAIYGKKRAEMTEEEQCELRLYDKWRHSKEKTILEEYAGKDIEEVPEEYREKIKVLRELMQKGKDNQVKKVMKKSVATSVGENQEIRGELHNQIEKQLAEKRTK